MNRFVFALFLLALLPLAFAQGTNSTTTSACQGNNDLLNTLTNLPGCIVETFFNYVVSGLISTTQGLVDATFGFIFSSPNPAWFCTPYNAVLSLLESLYSIVLMGIALFFIVRSNDISGRTTAKKWLEKMLVMIVILSFSFPLFQMMLDFNTYLATNLASESMKGIFSSPAGFTSAIFSLIILLPMISFMMLTFVTLLIRYLLIPFMLLLFPVAIFLYFIPLTESWGKTFLKIIAILVFMTTIDALLLLGLSSLFNAADPNLANSFVSAFLTLYGFGALGVVNLVLFILAILSIVSQSRAILTVVGIGLIGKALKVLL